MPDLKATEFSHLAVVNLQLFKAKRLSKIWFLKLISCKIYPKFDNLIRLAKFDKQNAKLKPPNQLNPELKFLNLNKLPIKHHSLGFIDFYFSSCA